MDAYRLYTYQTPSKPSHPIHTAPAAGSADDAMSNITLANLSYVTREDLSQQLLASPTPNPSSAPTSSTDTASASSLPPHIAIIDVRDSDHIGGHIRGSTWIPSNELDYRVPELVRTLREKRLVVFHCALSQQRGPSAALRYLREKERLDPESEMESKGVIIEGGEKGGKEGADGERQKVVVLEGGFTKWQEKYGPDKRLTEKWEKSIWEFGY